MKFWILGVGLPGSGVRSGTQHDNWPRGTCYTPQGDSAVPDTPRMEGFFSLSSHRSTWGTKKVMATQGHTARQTQGWSRRPGSRVCALNQYPIPFLMGSEPLSYPSCWREVVRKRNTRGLVLRHSRLS